MENATQTIATFTGTLVRRERNPGQQFVQLVFREGSENHLCITSKLAATKLQIGQDYRVEGEFRQVGNRAYIHEPKIRMAATKRQKWFLRKPVLIGSSVAATFLVVGGVVFALHGGSQPTLKATNTSAQSAFQRNSNSSNNDTAAPQTTTDTPVTTPTDTSTNTTPTTTNKTAPKVTAPVVNNPVPPPDPTPPTTPVSTAYCDAETAIAVTYTDVHIADDGVTHTGDVLTLGTPGSEKMCYDDAAGTNPHPVTVTAMVQGTKAIVDPAI